MPRKRDILLNLSNSKSLKERAKKTFGMRPLLTNPEFINCFMVSPAKVSGHTSVEEFATFCKSTAKTGTLYIRAKEIIKEEDEAEEKKEEEKVSRRANLKKLREQQAKDRAKEVENRHKFVEGNIGGVYFREDQKRVRDESGNVWEKFHHKCIIRMEGSEHSYCCESRKRKWEYDMTEFHKKEQERRDRWEELHEEEKEAKKPNIGKVKNDKDPANFLRASTPSKRNPLKPIANKFNYPQPVALKAKVPSKSERPGENGVRPCVGLPRRWTTFPSDSPFARYSARPSHREELHHRKCRRVHPRRSQGH